MSQSTRPSRPDIRPSRSSPAGNGTDPGIVNELSCRTKRSGRHPGSTTRLTTLPIRGYPYASKPQRQRARRPEMPAGPTREELDGQGCCTHGLTVCSSDRFSGRPRRLFRRRRSLRAARGRFPVHKIHRDRLHTSPFGDPPDFSIVRRRRVRIAQPACGCPSQDS